MMSLKDYIARVIDEENTQGDEGTSKLTKNRMRMTPGQLVVDVEKSVDQDKSKNQNE